MVCCRFDISRELLGCVVYIQRVLMVCFGLKYTLSSYGVLYIENIQGVHMVCCMFEISREFIWCVVGLKYTGSSYDVFINMIYSEFLWCVVVLKY